VRAALLAPLAVLALQAQPPQSQAFVLPNGLRVFHLEDHEHPLVRVWLRLDLVPGDTPAGLQGLPQLTQRMLQLPGREGATADEFERLLEGSGIQLTTSASGAALEWRLVARSRDQDRALSLLAESLLRTVFDAGDLMRQRQACWRDWEAAEATPRLRLLRTLGTEPGLRPTPASLGAITLSDLIAFRTRVFRPERAVLVLHGDLGLEQAKRLLLLNLGAWAAGPVPPAAAPATQAPTAPEALVRLPSQGPAVTLEALALPPPGLAPEVEALLGLLLPGDPLLAPIRISREEPGLVATLEAGPGAAGQAWAELQGRLEALRQRGFTQPDLDRARLAWQARRSLDALHPEALLEATLAEARGRSATPAAMRTLTLEALNTGLRRWLDPTRLRAGAAGPPEALARLAPPAPLAP